MTHERMPERGDPARGAWYTMQHGKVYITGLVVDYIDASRFEGRIIEHTWNNMGWTPKLVDKPRGNWKAGDPLVKMGPKCARAVRMEMHTDYRETKKERKGLAQRIYVGYLNQISDPLGFRT